MIEASIVRPMRRRNSPALGALALMVSNIQDLTAICGVWAPQGGLAQRGVFNSQLFYAPRIPQAPSATGPIIGAPYAVMILETLVAWGVRRILFLGWCGALSETLGIGDLVLPTRAIVDEGTSPAYGLSPGQSTSPHAGWQDFLRPALEALDLPLHQGAVWSTDAVFRETPSRVAHFAALGALAVEMEVSALYAAAQFLQGATGRCFGGFRQPGLCGLAARVWHATFCSDASTPVSLGRPSAARAAPGGRLIPRILSASG